MSELTELDIRQAVDPYAEELREHAMARVACGVPKSDIAVVLVPQGDAMQIKTAPLSMLRQRAELAPVIASLPEVQRTRPGLPVFLDLGEFTVVTTVPW